jgi:hypothetical protein
VSGIPTGCVPTYKFAGQTVATPDEGLRKQEAEHAAIRSEVVKASTHVGGTLRIVLPPIDRLRQLALEGRRAVNDEGADYVATADERTYELMADIVRERGAFDAVITERAASPPAPTRQTEDFIVWLSTPNAASFTWYLSGGTTGETQSVPLDKSLPLGAPRMTAWASSLEETARRTLTSSGHGTGSTTRARSREVRSGRTVSEVPVARQENPPDPQHQALLATALTFNRSQYRCGQVSSYVGEGGQGVARQMRASSDAVSQAVVQLLQKRGVVVQNAVGGVISTGDIPLGESINSWLQCLGRFNELTGTATGENYDRTFLQMSISVSGEAADTTSVIVATSLRGERDVNPGSGLLTPTAMSVS